MYLILVLHLVIILCFEKRIILLKCFLDYSTGCSHGNCRSDTYRSHVLLIYVYADVHVYAYGNLKYFVETAVREKDGVDYVFILQQVNNKVIDEKEMPVLPKRNAFYLQHENVCFDYGTIGWFFENHSIGEPWKRKNTSMNNTDQHKFHLPQYKYFILMNSSIRGPFFPPYFLQFLSDYQKDFNEIFYWYYIFTKRIDDRVKLVGCTINCAPQMHVQSYFLVTDFIGLSAILKDDGRVFECYKTQSDIIMHSEQGVSHRTLKANYMITSLLTKHHPLSFAKKHPCLSADNPYTDKFMDGVSLEPYEVVFVKFNNKTATFDAQNRAKLYQKWMEQATSNNRTSW